MQYDRALIELPCMEPARYLTLDGQRLSLNVAPGQTLRAVIEANVPEHLREYAVAFNHGDPVREWNFPIRPDDSLVIAIVPGGGKARVIIGTIISIIVSIYAPQIGAAVYGWATGATAAAVAGTTGALMTGAAIAVLTTMAVSAWTRPPPINTGGAGTTEGAKSYSLSGQSNQASAYSTCLVVYGRHKVMPLLATNPNVDNLGTLSQFSALYDFGLGNLMLEDIRVGDVPLDQFVTETYTHTNSLVRSLNVVWDRIGYDQYSVELQKDTPFIVRTKPETNAANLDIHFPRGLYQVGEKGPIIYHAELRARWRKAGDADWNEVPLSAYLGAASLKYVGSNPTAPTIEFSLPGPTAILDWTDYVVGSSVPVLRDYSAWWKAENVVGSVYLQSVPNPHTRFSYPSGAIDDASYFARYPELAGWPGSANNHFESIGSREGRDPGVPVNIVSDPMSGVSIAYPDGVYTVASSPTKLYNYDGASSFYFYTEPNSGRWGGWWFIAAGDPIPNLSPSNVEVPWQWRMKGSEVFQSATYLSRYNDAAAWVAAVPGRTAWDHFTQQGAFKGYDPYLWPVGSQSVEFAATSTNPYWARVSLTFATAGEYEIEIRRTDEGHDGSDTSQKSTSLGTVTSQVNLAVVGLLRSFQTGAPVNLRLRHTMLEMRVNATDKLQGVISNLSAIATSILPTTTDGVTFVDKPTRNPAWIALDILTSEKNPRPLSRSQVDWPSWIALAARCDTIRNWVINGKPYNAPAYTCDVVVSSSVVVRELVESVLSSARATITLTPAGKWGVIIDEVKTIPRQLITPANSWGFSGARSFPDYPHAFRVNFINRDLNYARDEVIVYDDGYSVANATKFETLNTYGITDYPHAWAFGRYMMAQGMLRSELFTLSLDAENMIVQRGDLVLVAHDVPMIGGVPARIDTVNAANAGPNGGTLIHVSLEVARAVTGYSLRRSDGSIHTGGILSATPGGWFELDTTAGEPDALIVLGEFQRTTVPYLVLGITPEANLTASLTLCHYVPAVYDADQGLIPDWDPTLGTDLVNGTDLATTNLAASQKLIYIVREPFATLLLTWRTDGWNLDHHEIAYFLPSGERRQLATGVRAFDFTWTVDALREPTLFAIPIQIEVTPIAGNGSIGKPAYLTVKLEPDRTAPAVVPMFGLNVEADRIDLFWNPPNEPDISHYVIRYTPDIAVTGRPDWNAAQALATVSYPTTKTSVGARTGSYGIRVVDTSGNMSEVEWRRTTVAVLPNINVLEVVDDRELSPPWPGGKSHVAVLGFEVQSEGDFPNIYPDGLYYYFEPVDLGDVYETRLSSKIKAYGVTADDYMVSWPNLVEVLTLARADSDLWDAWTEVRTNDALSVIGDWPTLSSVPVIAAGDESEWSIWRPFIVGDFTARLFQFRIQIKSYNPGVRVCVTSGRIEVDMPDRVDSYGDVNVPAAGLDFVFPVAFRKLESVAITINGSVDPLVATVTNKTPESFHVTLRHAGTGAARAGVIDILAEGYGRMRSAAI